MKNENGTSDSVKLGEEGLRYFNSLVEDAFRKADASGDPRPKKNAVMNAILRKACVDRGLIKKGGK